MSEDLSDVLNNFKTMMDNGELNVPDNIKEMLGNLNTNSVNTQNSSTGNNFANAPINNNTSTINYVQPAQSTNYSDTNSSNNNFNIDIETIMKMKSIIDGINNKNDPRANLLYSLKPYLRESRKNQLDQYVNLLNMTKIADIMKNDKKENNGNAK